MYIVLKARLKYFDMKSIDHPSMYLIMIHKPYHMCINLD